MTKTLAPLAASLRWYKRTLVADMTARLEGVTAPRLAIAMRGKLAKVRAMAPSAFRASYITARASEISLAPLAELRAVVPALVVLRAAL
jgi:hypothetical protein